MAPPRSRRPGPWLLAAPALAWLAVFYAGPLLLVGAAAFLGRGTPVEWTFTTEAWARLLDPLHLRIFVRSLVLAGVATAACALLGYPLCWYIVRRPPRTRSLLHLAVLLPLVANSLILLFAWMSILRNGGHLERLLRWAGLLGDAPLGFLYTPGAVALGLVYWYLPFLVYPLYASLEKLDPRLLEAAADLGADRWQTFRRIVLPLSLPGLSTGCLLVFLQSFCTFVVPELLGGSKTLMVGNLVQQRFLHLPQDWPLGAALSLVLLAVLALGVWGLLAARRDPADSIPTAT